MADPARLPGLADVMLVTVTYGERGDLLVQALASAFDQGVEAAIVVSNGSASSVEDRCVSAFGSRVRFVRNPRNLGSAPGFRAGIEQARVAGARFILLLDDDNTIAPGSVQVLLRTLVRMQSEQPDAPIAVAGFRAGNQVAIADGKARQALYPDAFFGFHLLHLPAKIWKRLRHRSPSCPLPAIGVLDFAPYSGLLFDASLVDRIGLPDPSFVLYADDTEFSYRITHAGGAIYVVTDARVVDIEASWNVRSRHRSGFDAWLDGGSELSVYYAARNRAFFESHRVPHRAWVRAVNRAAYLAILRVKGLRKGRLDRYRLFLRAIVDGEARELGPKQGFELT